MKKKYNRENPTVKFSLSKCGCGRAVVGGVDTAIGMGVEATSKALRMFFGIGVNGMQVCEGVGGGKSLMNFSY